MANPSITYQELIKAVLYAQQKPELLASIIADLLGIEKE